MGHTIPLEEMGNLRFPCKRHEPKPGVFIGQPREHFLGKIVKLKFKDKSKRRSEHMWVKVTALGLVHDELHATLDNDPVYATQWKSGDELAFKVEEAEDILYVGYGQPDPSERRGVQMIIYLQKALSGIDEPEDKALNAWRHMLTEHRHRVFALYRAIRISQGGMSEEEIRSIPEGGSGVEHGRADTGEALREPGQSPEPL